MLEFLLDGLASGLTYALLAAALTLVAVAWLGLDRPRRTDVDPRLRLPAVLLVALALAWLGRSALADAVIVVPAAPVLGWLLPPVLLAGLVWLWWASGLGRVWRAQAERPAAAGELGLPRRHASVAALGLAAVLGVAATLPATATVMTAVTAPEIKALVAALAAGPGHPVGAALLGLLAGLAEGYAAATAPDGWAGAWAQAAGYMALLPFLLLRRSGDARRLREGESG